MKVYCIVVTYNGEQWIDKCFGSLRQLDYPISIIAVDNGSTDNTVALLRTKYPEVEIIQPAKNLGFGMGNNVGIQKALTQGADYVFLFNQDAYVLRGSFQDLLRAFKTDNRAGIISPVHLAGDERNLDFGFYKYIDPKETPNLLGDFFSQQFKPLYQSKFINAAAWIMNASMIKEIGFFHPAFDHYGEDREYTSRMESKGWKIFVFPSLCIVHDRPQNRVSNKYHQYGQNFQRRMLQAMVEKKLTYTGVTLRFSKLFIENMVTLKPGKALLIYRSWKKLNQRRQFLSHQAFPIIENK